MGHRTNNLAVLCDLCEFGTEGCVDCFQSDDEYHPDRHHQHAADSQHGEVLEGSARHLCHAEACRGAHQECPVQATSDGSGHVLSALVSTAESTKDHQEVTAVSVTD